MLNTYALEQSMYALQERLQEEAATRRLLKSLPPRQSLLDRMSRTVYHWLDAQKQGWQPQGRPRIMPRRSATQALAQHD